MAGGEVIRQRSADRFFVILEGSFDGTRSPRWPSGAAPDDGGRWSSARSAAHRGSRSATVTAVTDGRILALEAPDFLALVEAGAEVGPRLLALHRGGGRAA